MVLLENRRLSGIPAGNYKVVITFACPVTVTNATVTPGAGGTASMSGTPTVNNTQVTVNLTNVSNAQTLRMDLLGLSDGTHTGNVSILMGVLIGDVDENSRVDGNDVSDVQSHTRQSVTNANFRYDIDANGRIDGNDVSATQSHTRTALP